MSETTIVKTGEDHVEEAGTELAQTVGETAAHVEHAVEKLEEHAENLTNLEGDLGWTKERLNSLEASVASMPETVAAGLKDEMGSLRSTVDSLVEKLSVTPHESGETTSTPEKVENKAKEESKSVFGRLGRALHKLL